MVDLKKFLPKNDEEQEYFWSLVIEPGWVNAGIWKVQKDSAQVFITSSPCAWELDKELVNAADSALSSAIQNFPEDQKEPSKTVFGVVSSWVAGGVIKEEYLERIKKVCSELSLKPVGFVVLPEAIAHLYKSEQASPLNGVVIGIYKETLEISVFRLGSLLGTTEVARSVSLADDVIEGLTRFIEGDSLPSRFILYDGKEGMLEEARQALLKVNWEDYGKLKFFHTPKVEIIEVKRKIYAVSLAGASEIANVTSIQIDQKEPESVPTEYSQEEAEAGEETSVEKLGFALEKDITAEKPTEGVQEGEVEKPRFDESLKNFEPVFEEKERPLGLKSKISLEGVSGLGGKISSFFSLFSFIKKFGKTGNKHFLLGGGFLVALFLIGFFLWWFYPKATVTIYISPKRLEEKIDTTVDQDKDSIDVSKGVVTGKLVESEVSGERTRETTGTKTVGDKAKGEVTLYRVGSQLTLEGGTLLRGPDNLDFALDNSTTVASGSAGSPGTITASVTAKEIGAQYNLASGTMFSVSNYSTSDIEAKNENAFSGGSSREISAVSEEDQKVLQEELEGELVDKAKEELIQNLSKDKLFIEESIDSTISSKTFSNKVGDEASTLKLTLTLKVKALVVDRSQLVELASSKLSDKVPEGFILRDEQMDFQFGKKREQDLYEFDLRVSANLLPKVDTNEVAKKIRGRYLEVALGILEKEIPGFVRAEVKIRPNLPGRLKTLPHVVKNIEVELAADR